jgi:hypothetical protein
MRKLILVSAVTAAVLSSGLPAARACGDKSLRIGRGVRFRRTTTPASIIIYVSPTASAEAFSKAPRLQSFLKKAGHKSRVVQGEGPLAEALSAGHYDLVLSSLGEAAHLQSRLDATPSRPALVPIVFNGTQSDVASAERHYGHVVKDASSGEDYLEAIEAAMKARAHA